MKKLLLTMVTLLSMTAMTAQTSNGERKAPKKMTHEEMTTQMVSQLKLNDAQKTKEYQDYLMPEPPQKPEGQAGSDGDKAKQKKAGNKKQSAGNHQAKRQEYEKKLKTILTDDQYKSYQKMGPQGKGKGSKPKQKPQSNS